MLIITEIKIIDEDTGVVEETIIKTHDGSYGYEVASFFRKIGEKIAKDIDPTYDID